MNNNMNQPILPQARPAVPFSNGRSSHNGPYPYPQQQAPFPPFAPGQYPMRPPQQWSPQYSVPMPLPRGYQPYQSMSPYPMPQHIAPIRPSLYQTASSSSIRSPSSSSPSLPPPSNPYLAPPTPPPPPPSILPSANRRPFYPPLPWQSFDGAFPPRAPRRRKRIPAPQSSNIPVELPSRRESLDDEDTDTVAVCTAEGDTAAKAEVLSEHLTLETPTTTNPPSEAFSTQPTTPSSVAPPQQATPKVKASGRPNNVPVVPIVPAIPNLPIASRPFEKASTSATSDVLHGGIPSNADHLVNAVKTAAQIHAEEDDRSEKSTESSAIPPTKVVPKSWADLVRIKGTSTTSSKAQNSSSIAVQTNGFTPTKAGSLADALSSYSVKDNDGATKVAFLEPRGLVNTGNMCYMNSILQILVFCVPFYNFLENIGKQAAHSFKSDTPLMDAMIMFMREFSIIDAAVSADQLRMRLKDKELEQYGEAFIPEFVYEVIRRLPRFSSMRRGHQQDAEEFLGFVLEEMHDECTRAMKPIHAKPSSGASTPTNGVTSPNRNCPNPNTADGGGWLEVGPKQRAAITRSSGAIENESPVTKIFGGKLRSELRVPGMKNSVTLEPYQPLQLDIGAPNISNIIDALKGLTKSETLHGAFNSPRGPGSTATKQVSIETLPQVLILHLKRFQYDSNGGTQKIWRKVGYPLDLEIPKELFPQHKRGGLTAHGGLPKYRLVGIVYHHGKNASGGHYTVDVRRQEGREWIRLDDTVIQRIRSEDVAEGGSEEDPKVLAAALEQHKNEQQQSSNVYEQIAAEDEAQKEAGKGWSQVNGSASGSSAGIKKWSGVANGKETPTKTSGKDTPSGRASVKDNKVAYILFYQRASL